MTLSSGGGAIKSGKIGEFQKMGPQSTRSITLVLSSISLYELSMADGRKLAVLSSAGGAVLVENSVWKTISGGN